MITTCHQEQYLPDQPINQDKQAPLYNLLQKGILYTGEQVSSTLDTSGIPFGINEVDAVLPHHGLQQGAIHEFCAASAKRKNAHPPCTLIATLLANYYRHRSSAQRKKSLWISEQKHWPTPFVLQRTIEHLDSCIFLSPPNSREQLWLIETALRSPAVGIVVAAFTQELSAVLARRLAMLAKHHGTTALMIVPYFGHKNVTHSRWQVEAVPARGKNPTFSLTLHSLQGFKSPDQSSWTIELQQGGIQHDAHLSFALSSATALRTSSTARKHQRVA